MTGSRSLHWILSCLVAAAFVFIGCTSDTTTSSEGSGSLSLNLELAPGIVINEVDWTITSPGMDPMSGTIDTSAPGATASVEVFGLPPGDDYMVELEATDESGEVTCRGSTPFGVEVGEATDIMVMLNCKLPSRLGGVRVNGKFNVCAELAKVIVSPLQTSVGFQIDLSATAQDVEGDPVTYVWSATGGDIADSNAQFTTYTCGAVGEQTITITVSDDDFEFCMHDWTVPVNCVDDGQNLCDGVVCDDDGNECTVAECNPATGQCETENVDDGTDCNGGAGMCMNGECVDADLCEGVECNDENECTDDVCDPETGECEFTPVDDGTDCNGGAGMCVGGQCMDVDLCEGVECPDTGLECTVGVCNIESGECEEMNVENGTPCDGGSGVCDSGSCVPNNLCEGVDCSSQDECVQDGTCDPADGACIPGDPEPAGTSCSVGVCDGAGACVQCVDASQCGGGDQCNAAACVGNACTTEPVMDGTPCDFMSAGDGVCEGGQCVAAPECTVADDCDDGNECTVEDCVDGACQVDPNEGASCTTGSDPGTCDNAGNCVGLCQGVDCTSNDECVQDGTCDPSSGQCVPGNAEEPGVPCSGGVCDGGGACVECLNDNNCSSGQVCMNNMCMAGGVDPDPVERIIDLGCTNNVTADVSILPFLLGVDPGTISGGAAYDAELGGIAQFSEVFLDAAQGAVPGGVTRANLVDLRSTVTVRSGASGADVTLGPVDLPYECALTGTPCDPANDVASVPGNRGNTDCQPQGFFNACGRFVTVPTSSNCGIPGDCDATAKQAQCSTNGFCVTGGLPLPLAPATGSYTADPSPTSILYGWDDQNTGATVNPDGTWALPPAVFTAAAGPNSIRVNASGLSVALECTMGVDSGGPDGVGVPDQASPTPDDLLISFDIP